MSLLPDPEARPRPFTVISVDDHLIEPPDLFDGRMPAHLVDRAPRVVELDGGNQAWAFEDALYPNIGLNAVIGRPKDEWSMDPVRFDEMRKGCWDIHARIADMDTARHLGVAVLPVVAGRVRGHDVRRAPRTTSSGSACVRRVERLAPRGVGRHVPRADHPAADHVVATTRSSPRQEVRRNAGARLQGAELSREPVPHRPAVDAHRSLGSVPRGVRGDRHGDVPPHRFGRVVARPRSRRTARAEHHAVPRERHRRHRRLAVGAHPAALPAAERGALGRRDRLGADAPRPPRLRDVALRCRRCGRVGRRRHADAKRCSATSGSAPSTTRRRWARASASGSTTSWWRVDYPHADSSWPDTQELLRQRFAGLPDADVRKMTHENAARLFRHPLPDDGWTTAATE